MVIRGGQIDGAAIHGSAAMADVKRAVGRVLRMPELLAGAGVDGPEMVGRGDVRTPSTRMVMVSSEVGRGRKRQASFELPDIPRSDLREGAAPWAEVIAMEIEPGIRRGMKELVGVDALCRCQCCEDRGENERIAHRFPGVRFKVSR